MHTFTPMSIVPLRRRKTAQRRFSSAVMIVLSGFALSGCFIIRPFAGADIDINRLQRAREATMIGVQRDGALRLADRLATNDPVQNADLVFYFSEALLNKASSQLDGTTGWLDSLNSYSIRTIRVKLHNGSAIATIAMSAFNHEYDVDVNLAMDCILAFSLDSGKFVATLEPFNVVPNIKAGGMIASLEGVIRDIVTMKLSTLSSSFPPIQFPLDFNNQFPVQGSSVQVREGINMDITTPAYLLKYSLALKEVLIFADQVVVAMNVRTVGVRK